MYVCFLSKDTKETESLYSKDKKKQVFLALAFFNVVRNSACD